MGRLALISIVSGLMSAQGLTQNAPPTRPANAPGAPKWTAISGAVENAPVDAEGNFLGSVSGCCVEGSVIEEAADVIADGRPRMLEFGVADEAAWKVGLSCGGKIRVYVERVD